MTAPDCRARVQQRRPDLEQFRMPGRYQAVLAVEGRVHHRGRQAPVGQGVHDRGPQPGGQRVEFVVGAQQPAAEADQFGYLPREHRLDEVQPGGEMPVQRPAGHPCPPGDLVQRGVHAGLGERDPRLLDQLPVVAPGVRAHRSRPAPRIVTCQRNHRSLLTGDTVRYRVHLTGLCLTLPE